MKPSRPRYDCTAGRHHCRSDAAQIDGGVARSTCVRCGCALFRTDASRRWILSGTLGVATGRARGDAGASARM